MKLEIANKIADEVCAPDVRIDEHYSGRGMWGKETAAIKCSAAYTADRVRGIAANMGVQLRSDSMGLGWVLY